ncbi:37S ribosomal protein S35, mitochondrial [Fusarium austroafricanum]|uniref:37S ribosomal protein S35, mitochondrial n=1 Tax=Fusarium austroafricanum TaxID=2364996 RepID=A0A8H4P0T5_9HYPO|nr:37S ribosomal protein S35, mitochondrial [Fusarium austroafricanum]
MPPRVRGASTPLAGLDATISLSLSTRSSSSPFLRTFSTTPCREKMSKGRAMMFQWLNDGGGRNLAEAGNNPNYLGPHQDQPFPLNPLFRSQPVLSDATRELIYDKVRARGESLKAVSAEMHIDVRRVAAVVRLKEVEKQWMSEGKQLATPYAKAVMRMLPKTHFEEGGENVPHEPINEIHVHNLTMQQLFQPVSESRHFTREDAAKAFHDKMLSADDRSPQPELIKMERDIIKGSPRPEALAKFKETTQADEDKIAQKILNDRKREEERTKRVKTDRYEFRFKEINVDDVGRDGRSRRGTGWRYGAPFEDRKRGLVKIPTSVP